MEYFTDPEILYIERFGEPSESGAWAWWLDGQGENTTSARRLDRQGENTASARRLGRQGENTTSARRLDRQGGDPYIACCAYCKKRLRTVFADTVKGDAGEYFCSVDCLGLALNSQKSNDKEML